MVVATGGEPVRCCLSDADAGQPLLLVNVDLGIPGTSPYTGSGPVYLHRDPGCDVGPRTEYPRAWRGRRQVLRGHDARGWIAAAAEHDGSRPEDAIDEVLAAPGVVQVLSSNVLHGCFMLRATRGTP